MNFPDPELLTGMLAAWLLLLAAALWARRDGIGVTKPMLLASLRGLVQLLLLAYVLHFIFDLSHPLAQAAIVLGFCLIAARISAGHHPHFNRAWLATTLGLAAASLFTLPWLVFTGAISGETRALIPLASMVVANGMNAVSLMFNRMEKSTEVATGIKAALIPSIDTLRVVGLVHMPGIFVGMILAGAAPLTAAAAQLVVLYMIVASNFTACIVTWYFLQRGNNQPTCA